MRSSILLLALAALGAGPALAQPPAGGWGPNGWNAGARGPDAPPPPPPGADAPLPPGHPPVTAGEPLPPGHPPVIAGEGRDRMGPPPRGPHGMRDHGPRHDWMGHDGPPPRGDDGYFYVEGGPEGGYYYVPGAPQPYGYPGYGYPGYAPGATVYTNPTGPVMVAPGTTVIVKVQPTVTKTVTEEWVPAAPKRHWGSKSRCRCN